ncbi:hypothetical protein PPERSA_07656 [Pseudocohnilembus persalinus]|uniref:Uncharacterized protein n=1 Tax=Pseudocohnilembus persalinus TaxID=266149 RepID=A0A0V0QIL9_PSEPJ|nr:hypothetical protein PPERSA_07656 [Pseudocohnilembus persalinus]|eukprot:KRX02011.1 hypothetical protein PPERSA_07656 [Pseudocohnilembus persalinus]
MKQHQGFLPDPRNLGGRVSTGNYMYNHQKALNTIKPTINNKQKPKEHVDANKQKKPLLYKNLETYGNVYKTFNAVHTNIKPQINTKEPETMKLKHLNQDPQKPKYKPNKQQLHLEAEHQKRLKAQQDRFKAMYTEKERKKNQFDPVSHPVVLFRRGEDKSGTNHYMKTMGTRSVQMGITNTQLKNKSAYQKDSQSIKAKSQFDNDEMRSIRNWNRTEKNIQKGGNLSKQRPKTAQNQIQQKQQNLENLSENKQDMYDAPITLYR